MFAAARNQQSHILQLMTRSQTAEAGLEHTRADDITGADREQREHDGRPPSPSALPNQPNHDGQQRRDPIFLRRDRHPKPIPNRMGNEMIEKIKEAGVVMLQNGDEIQFIYRFLRKKILIKIK